MTRPSKKIDCINILLNTGWWEKDDELIQKLDLNKVYLEVSEGDLWLTDGTTSVVVADYSTITVQTYDDAGEELVDVGIPIPNEVTLEAMREAEHPENLETFDSVDELSDI